MLPLEASFTSRSMSMASFRKVPAARALAWGLPRFINLISSLRPPAATTLSETLLCSAISKRTETHASCSAPKQLAGF